MSTQDSSSNHTPAIAVGSGLPHNDLARYGLLSRPAIPEGFHVHRMPANGRKRAVVCRNWRRSMKRSTRDHVLVFDREPAIHDIVGQLLDGEGYDVTLSYHMLSSDDIIRLRPDVVIGDGSFDGASDGFPLQDISRTRGSRPGIPVIYCTSEPEFAAARSGQGDTTLLKPYDLEELLELLAHVID